MPLTLTDDVFADLMGSFTLPEKAPLAVAVSGGADSLCLAFFLVRWGKKNHHPVVILTVNHGLRPEAAEEVRLVASYAKKWGTPCQELCWEGEKPTCGIEEKARAARYGLMSDYCLQHHISYLFLAHHGYDQIETLLARLSHGSGLTGLCGMEKCSYQRALFLCRPFLSLSKKDILQTAAHLHLCWAEDAMNTDDTFERVRWRKTIPLLESLGLSLPQITTSLTRLQRANAALEQETHHFITTLVEVNPRGYVSFLKKDFAALPDELRLRVLQKLIGFVGKSDGPLSLATLEKKCVLPLKTFTLGACVVVPFQRKIFIGKEKRYMPPAIPVLKNRPVLWDRFIITPDKDGLLTTGSAPRSKKIPALICKTIPVVLNEKGVEISFKIAYKSQDKFFEKKEKK